MSERAGLDQYRFRQVQIPPGQLQAGVYSPQNKLVPWGAIATLQPGAMDLQEQLGIRFSDSHDQLDYLKIALLEMPSRKCVALVEHSSAPTPGLEVHADVTSAPAAADLLDEILETLGLPEDAVTWRRP